MDPLLLAVAAFVVVIVGVLWIRLPPFLALIFAALLVAIGTPTEQIRDDAIKQKATRVGKVHQNTFRSNDIGSGGYLVFRQQSAGLQCVGDIDTKRVPGMGSSAGVGTIPDGEVTFTGTEIQEGDYLLHYPRASEAVSASKVSAASRVAFGFGDTCRKIGLLIAMASVIGCCLLESGAARRIVDATRSAFGEERTPLAFAASGFVVGIPVFFDTVFYLLMPLAKAMRVKTGKNYLLYVMSIVVGASMAHSLVPPTPGPLLVASKIEGVEVVDMMLGGLIVGFFAVASGYLYSLWANRQWEIPLREIAHEDVVANTSDNVSDSMSDANQKPPSLLASILPIALPVFLLAAGTLTKNLSLGDEGFSGVLKNTTTFLGDKNIALTLAAIVGLAILITQKRKIGDSTWTKSVQNSLSSGGMILLITAAGGAFGHVLRQSGVAEAIQQRFPASRNDIALLVVAFVITMLVRFVQGSATVAMITSVSIVAPLASELALSYHPVYLALAIGCGSKPLPWMNDSGFWIVGRMSGMTEVETLRTFSVTLTIMGMVGFLVTLAGAVLLPFALVP